MNRPVHPVPIGLLRVLVLLILFGIGLRFFNLDHKLYWHDEVITSARVAGYYSQDFFPKVFDGHLVSVAELQQYQHLTPDKGITDVIHSLRLEDAHHPPLYYLLLRGMSQVWGLSITLTRGVSALISVLAFPALYWLCLELFASPLVGWLAMALMATSPLHLLYAQEAREYSLWILTILLSSAALLRAIRVKTVLAWGLYTLTLTLGFYTYLLHTLVAVGQGIYVFGSQAGRHTRVRRAYPLATVTDSSCLCPGCGVVANTYQTVRGNMDWTQQPIPFADLICLWGLNVSYCSWISDYPISIPSRP